MSDSDFSLNNLKKFQDNLLKAKSMYPDIAQEKLEETALKFKNRVATLTKEAVKADADNLVKGFKLEKVQKNGSSLDLQFVSTHPEFQKIESGYNQVLANGKTGWVPGKQIIGRATEEFQKSIGNEMNGLVDVLTRRCGLV